MYNTVWIVVLIVFLKLKSVTLLLRSTWAAFKNCTLCFTQLRIQNYAFKMFKWFVLWFNFILFFPKKRISLICLIICCLFPLHLNGFCKYYRVWWQSGSAVYISTLTLPMSFKLHFRFLLNSRPQQWFCEVHVWMIDGLWMAAFWLYTIF